MGGKREKHARKLSLSVKYETKQRTQPRPAQKEGGTVLGSPSRGKGSIRSLGEKE